jgi:hypothetical protein
MNIQIPKTIFGQEVKGAMARLEEALKNGKGVPAPQVPGTGIQANSDFWKIPGVNDRGKIGTYGLSKTLLDNGSSKTQDEWASYSEQAKQRQDFYLGDMPLYHSISTALFKQPESQNREEARVFIQKNMREKYLMTLTRVAYQPKGKDKIIHNFGISEQYLLDELIVGEDRVIETKDSKALTVLLGTGDISEINSVYQWLNQTNAYIWRLNNKPKQVDERVAWFDAGSGGAGLDCGGGPADTGAGLGVRACAEGAAPKI